MNRNDARKIAETITNEELQQMFETAKVKITDWTKVSDDLKPKKKVREFQPPVHQDPKFTSDIENNYPL